MSSIMRARSGLMRRSERLEGIGGFLSRAEGCWTFDARDRVPQSSPSTAHRPAQLRTGGDARPSRESGFVRCPEAVIQALDVLGAQVHDAAAPELAGEVQILLSPRSARWGGNAHPFRTSVRDELRNWRKLRRFTCPGQCRGRFPP